jgi:transposase InsO family protein
MTFTQWLSWWWASPTTKNSRARMYTDDQYFLLMEALSSVRVSEMDISLSTRQWIYHKRVTHTYYALDMFYDRGPDLPKQYGRVLTYVENPPVDRPANGDEMRRVISYSQLELALRDCHENNTGHRGQDATEYNVCKRYEGINRELIRQYVIRCPVCQVKRARQFKPLLQPIVTRQMFERFLIDLIDFHHQPDGPYRYIMHVADHRTRFHWARPITSKEAASVAAELDIIFSMTGGVQILQSDNGGEFKGEVSEVCQQFGVQQVFSSPYHPETNGLIEKGNHTLKVLIAKYQERNNTSSWAACIPRAVLQMNTTISRVIRVTPFELVYGHRHRVECIPILDRHHLLWLENQDWAPGSDGQPARPPQILPDPDDLFDLAELASAQAHSPVPSPLLQPSSSGGQPIDSSSSPDAVTALLADTDVLDAAFLQSGELGKLAAAKLNVAGNHFCRCGCCGRGRCCIASVELAMRDCQWSGTEQTLLQYCDDVRAEYKRMVEGWGDTEKARWLQAMIDIGGGDVVLGRQSVAAARERMRQDVLRDLSNPSISLGWEYLVLAHVKHRVNILVVPIMSSEVATEEWEGGDVTTVAAELVHIEIQLIPYQFDPQRPFIVVYHRSYHRIFTAATQPETHSTSGGHYEVVCWSGAERDQRQSLIPPGHPAYSHLQRLAQERLAAHASEKAQQSMETYYNAGINVRQFQALEAVGLRTNTSKKRTKKRSVHNIPALIVEVYENQQDGGAVTRQPMYRCLTRHGFIDRAVKVDGLVDISENNHAEVFEQLRSQAQEALSSSQSMREWFRERTLTLERALEEELKSVEQPARAVGRRQPQRAVEVAVVESDGVASTEQTTAALQHMVRIVAQQGKRYRVEWSQPEEAPERTWELMSKLDSRAEYVELVLAWRAQQEQQEQ